jgi:hypothetical protein
MSDVTTTDLRMMITLAIFMFAIALCIVPFFFIGSAQYQVGVFSGGLAVFILAFGYLFV